jgi:hypothetical protein
MLLIFSMIKSNKINMRTPLLIFNKTGLAKIVVPISVTTSKGKPHLIKKTSIRTKDFI